MEWKLLGTGMNLAVRALVVDSVDNLYAGGSFTTAGGSAVNRVARWNGTTWGALDSGIPWVGARVNALDVDPWGNIYAGGSFPGYVARWDGEGWRSLGSGVDNTINALAVDGSSLFAGGLFTKAGGNSAHHMARCQLPAALRIAGSSRYTTAVEISKKGWAGGADTVILARGDNYADALAGVPLAYYLDAPILLTRPDRLAEATREEIQRLNATQVLILGGSGAISDDVENDLKGMGITVERIAGANRYATAAVIAERLRIEGSQFNSAFIAVGTNFADALAASSYAAMRGEPILLTATNRLSAPTDAILKKLEVSSTIVCGGEGAVSSEVFDLLPNPQRIAGTNRYATGVALAEEFLPAGTIHTCMATGLNFPDAIAGGVLSARMNTGVILVRGDRSTPNDVVQEFMNTMGITSVALFGGSSVISEEIQTWFEDNLGK